MPNVRRKTEKYDRDSVYRIYDKVEQKWFNYRNFGWRTWVDYAENARFYKRISDAVNSFGYKYGNYGLVISEDRYVVVEFKLVRGNKEVPLVVEETFSERLERERQPTPHLGILKR